MKVYANQGPNVIELLIKNLILDAFIWKNIVVPTLDTFRQIHKSLYNVKKISYSLRSFIIL